MTKTCKTCNWWNQWQPEEGFCQHGRVGVSFALKNALWVQGNAGGGKTLMTGPDFGCVHHRGKE